MVNQYQITPIKHLCQRKPRPSRIIYLEDEIIMTLRTEASYLLMIHCHTQTEEFGGTFNKCERIDYFTEQYIEHSKNDNAQYQAYSAYKSRNTFKLIFCTLLRRFMFRSLYYWRYIAPKLTPGFIVLFNKGFNVLDLFSSRQKTSVLPQFVRGKIQFTSFEVHQGKQEAEAAWKLTTLRKTWHVNLCLIYFSKYTRWDGFFYEKNVQKFTLLWSVKYS